MPSGVNATRLYPDAIPTRPEEFEAWWAQGRQALQVLDGQLQSRQYLVDDRFSIADIALYAYVHRAAEGGFDLAPFAGATQLVRPHRSASGLSADGRDTALG